MHPCLLRFDTLEMCFKISVSIPIFFPFLRLHWQVWSSTVVSEVSRLPSSARKFAALGHKDACNDYSTTPMPG